MIDMINEVTQNLFTPENFSKLLRIALILVIGFTILNIVKVLIVRNIRERTSAQTLMLTRKVIIYTGGFIIVFMALREAGLNLNILLGTAGVAGIAIGFASQTSVSNIISSLFLISEKPFEVNDVITVGGRTGIVMSIDLLSVKIRTFGNTYVRIPNETIIKTEVTNITRFPIRRLDINLKVDFTEDVERVRDLLIEITAANPHLLDNPAPLFIFNGFGDSAIDLFFGVWFEKSSYIAAKNSIMLEIKEAFEKAGIAIPYQGIRLVNPADQLPLPAETGPMAES
jgi:small-conductance mechanosensitive channel